MPGNGSFCPTRYVSGCRASIFLHLGISVNFKGSEQSAQGQGQGRERNVRAFSQLPAVIDNPDPTAYSESTTYTVCFPSHSKQKTKTRLLTYLTPSIRNALYHQTKPSAVVPLVFVACANAKMLDLQSKSDRGLFSRWGLFTCKSRSFHLMEKQAQGQNTTWKMDFLNINQFLFFLKN